MGMGGPATEAAFVSGRIDGYDPETGVLHDYKTTRRLPSRVSAPHRRQVELYAWLLHRNGFGLPHAIRLLYLSMTGLRSFDLPVPTPHQLDALEQDLLVHIRRLLCAFTQCPVHHSHQPSAVSPQTDEEA
jgi:RecB family exonuclease